MQNAALGNKKYCIRGHKEMGLEEFYHEESNTLYDSEHQDQQEYKKVTNKVCHYVPKLIHKSF
jgi:hypothetical protein